MPAETVRVSGEVRAGVIGVGHLGAIHAALWREVEGARLVGVLDADGARAAGIAAQHGVRAFGDLASLLDAVDVVSVVTPTSTHSAVAREALARGRHCLVEKPITATVADARELCEAAARARCVLQVGHIERFNPALLAVEDRIGAPRFIESHRLAPFSTRATDVAVVHDLMIHDIDVILSLVRAPVTHLDATGVAVVSAHADIANARLQFADGCVANVTASRITATPMRKMRIFQRDAYLSIDFAAPAVEIFRLADAQESPRGGTTRLGDVARGATPRAILYEQPPVPPVNALKRELELFVRSVRTGAPPAVTGEEGARALEVAEAIVRRIGGARVD